MKLHLGHNKLEDLQKNLWITVRIQVLSMSLLQTKCIFSPLILTFDLNFFFCGLAKSDQFMTKSQESSRNSPALPSQQQSPINDVRNLYHTLFLKVKLNLNGIFYLHVFLFKDLLRKKAGLSSRGQQSILHKTEYSRQFNVMQASAAPSPILTAHQVRRYSNVSHSKCS